MQLMATAGSTQALAKPSRGQDYRPSLRHDCGVVARFKDVFRSPCTLERMRFGRAVVPILMVAYGIAAYLGLSFWFPLTGSTPIWFPTLEVGLGIVILWVAVGIARGRRWALSPPWP